MTKTVIYALLAGIATLIITFILTNVVYLAWADWRYPETNSMAGLGAVMLSLVVAPICALISIALAVFFRRRTL